MDSVFTVAAAWAGLALLATALASHLKVSLALVEIGVGVAAGAVASRFFGPEALGSNLPWLRFLAGTGAVLLTFLAGTELDPDRLRAKGKEVLLVGFVGFLAPFAGCAAWPASPSVGTSRRASSPGWPSPPPRWPWSTR